MNLSSVSDRMGITSPRVSPAVIFRVDIGSAMYSGRLVSNVTVYFSFGSPGNGRKCTGRQDEIRRRINTPPSERGKGLISVLNVCSFSKPPLSDYGIINENTTIFGLETSNKVLCFIKTL